ncbi:4Fe-4S dicluster domain-containing protein [Chloroflexota bacterium]
MKSFVIDVRLCIGCYNCQIACKDEHCGNDWTPYAKPQPDTGQFWLEVREEERGTIPKVTVTYIPWMCQHCDDAPCMKVCPVEAIYKRDDGLVIIDPKMCNGCMHCVDACPYGSIFYNETIGLAQKCTGCAHLLDRGWPIKEPRCVDVCWGAMFFGEESELQSMISNAEELLPGEDTNPRVHYLNLPKKFIGGTVYDPDAKEIIEDATCTLSGDGTGTATTDGFGDFWFTGLKDDGMYSLMIESNGKTKTISDISTEKDVNLGDIALS